ncbi:MAG: chloride channel protein, partial [Muribaculaceae bacterium]|nr:chloride channel protein [Muribaculaceae bacterium]
MIKQHIVNLRDKFAGSPIIVVGPVVCLVVGLLTGAAAALLKWLIGHMSELAKSLMHLESGNWTLIVLPVIGIVLTGIFCRYVLRRNIEHSSEKIKNALHHGMDNVSGKLIYGPLIASTFTLGFGGSAGSEGPIATVGAALGGNISRKLGLSDDIVRVMIGCGAGAGIAGIFKAPVGGMLFTLECMAMPLSTLAVIGILATCMVSSLTAYVLSGYVPDLSLERFVPQSTQYIPAVILLGLICGFYALYYNATGRAVARRLGAMANPWVRNVASGLGVGLLLFMFPALYGEGYSVVADLMNKPDYVLGDYSPLYFLKEFHGYGLLLIAVGILLVKGIAAYGSNSGGGVAGDFAPTLFAGAIMGYVVVLASRTIFGVELPMPVFVLGGMAGVMAGAVKAPLMAIFLTVEMTASYEYLLPVSIAGI